MSETITKKRKRAAKEKTVPRAITGIRDSGSGEEVAQASALVLRFREAGMLFLLVLAAFTALALFSYSPTDPGWSYVGYEGEVANSTGKAGAWFSDVLFSLFGVFAWWIPVLLVIKTVLVFRYRYSAWHWQPGWFVMRSLGLLLALATGAALAAIHLEGAGESLPARSGGILGRMIMEQSLPVFNLIGSTLILLAIFLVGFTLYTHLSWFQVLDATGRLLKIAFAKLGKGIFGLAEVVKSRIARWKEQRELDREAFQGAAQPKPAQEPADVSPGERQEPVLVLPAPKSEEQVGKMAVARNIAAADEMAFAVGENVVEIPPEGELPGVGLLDKIQDHGNGVKQEELDIVSRLLEAKLADFAVKAEVVAVHPGPVITRYEIQPAPGVKASKISNLARDLARSLAVVSVRVVEVIPGKSVMGIEIPNDDRETVFFAELIASRAYEKAASPLSLALGHDIAGQPVVVDLAKMPHLLVAGTTGSGKSVGVNAMLLSMLFKSGPEDVRLIMIDPKMLELSIYDGIPHLLSPVVTDMKEAANALRWCVAEMERRYKLMAALGVRNIAGYNKKVKEAKAAGKPLRDPFYEAMTLGDLAPELEALPFIVVVVDEFADMMMIVGKKVEELIARIAQKARAAGIHLILATQRPSVDVITGLIKANVPTRISFQVSSKIDSRTIIDQGGAEQLLGHGDMLYLPPGTSVPIRIHGAFVSDDEVHRVVADWKKRGQPDYVDAVLSGAETASDGNAISGGLDEDSEQDALYDEAVAFVTESRRASISSVQRKLKIGYNRAARIIETMEVAGVVSPAGHNGNREVIAPPPVKG
ncbi:MULTISPECIES: DNA translocase FtsK [unclassified Endozoicomonas]|uniref:DNA translocase FtsK n=2 Tax=Endozoicomonas TaxID=305899 RepID=UPI0021493197|nr:MULTISPECIES: DNA translocase FtsK [unclassified Endozoicomonas]